MDPVLGLWLRGIVHRVDGLGDVSAEEVGRSGGCIAARQPGNVLRRVLMHSRLASVQMLVEIGSARPHPEMNFNLNPLDWINAAQDWFVKTEKSSGFRPYLIFLLIVLGFSLSLLCIFWNEPDVRSFVFNIVYIVVISFIVLFTAKSFHQPDFCRSEKHIETVKRIEFSEQKGDKGPKLIEETSVTEVEATESEGSHPETLEDGEK